MTKKLFVGGLSFGTTDQDLSAAFAGCGTVVEVKVITDRETGRSRGFGFVTMESAEDVEKALRTLDGSEIAGRRVRVSLAEEKRKDGSSDRSPPKGRY
jgi:RNA recognition motif-containing protein